MVLAVASIPFALHIVVEVPAVLQFALYPSSTLQVPQPHAHAVVRQYALLLLSTIVIAVIFVVASGDQIWIERGVAGSLSLYHLGPIIRAIDRGQRGEGRGRRSLQRPWMHAVVHLTCWIALAGRGFDLW